MPLQRLVWLWGALIGLGVLFLTVACSSSSPVPTSTSTPFPTAMPALTVYEASVIEDGCDAADKMLYILEGGIGRDEQFSEKVLERGMMRVIQDYDSNEDALAVHMDVMVEAVLVAEQNHGYPSKLTQPSLMVGNTLKNWANTLDIYDYRNVLVSLEVFFENCSDIAKKLSPEAP